MKPTQEQLDQLVSGYIDGVLDDEESHQFQGLMKSDPSIADQLNKAVEIRESVKLAFQAAPTVRPPEALLPKSSRLLLLVLMKKGWSCHIH